MKTDILAITNDGNNIDPDFEMTTARTYGEWLLRIRRNADDAAALGQRGDALAKAGDYGAAIPFSPGPWRRATLTQQEKSLPIVLHRQRFCVCGLCQRSVCEPGHRPGFLFLSRQFFTNSGRRFASFSSALPAWSMPSASGYDSASIASSSLQPDSPKNTFAAVRTITWLM